MAHAPECLKERFKTADELVQELNESKCINENCSIEEPGVKLLCQFWNLLKDNPTLDLTEAVKDQMKKIQKHNLSIPLTVTNLPFSTTGSSDVICECAGDVCTCDQDNDSTSKKSTPCCSLKAPKEPPGEDAPPLTKAIYNINEAASIGKKCGNEIKTLIGIQKELEEEVKMLEDKEKEVEATLKQADCMRMCMEEAYKKRIEEAIAKQETLMKELKEAEASKTKWKKNQKDLELEVANVDKCHKEMQQKTKEKANDLKSIETEVKNLKKQIADTKRDLESTRKSADNKKKTSDNKLASIAVQIKKLEHTLEEERKRKHEKESDGNRAIKEARDEVQYLNTVLLRHKLENRDMIQERKILQADMDVLNEMAIRCYDTCNDRENSIDEEIARVDREIVKYREKCMKCHECTHTLDIKAFCMECPRCTQEDNFNDCCGSDKSTDCVCMYVKEKFMSNVLENICNVLKKHCQTESGIAVAETILNSLKRSRNGKLDGETRRKLQDFIVSAMKKNLHDSIVGGAAKTRCELDQNTYDQLMKCLKECRVEALSTSDGDRKVCCPRFDKTECNCPGGPDGCVCQFVCPRPCGSSGVKQKPSRSSKTRTCSNNADREVVLWKTESCEGSSCKTTSSMRAVQCGLGPEVLTRESVAQSKCCDGCQVYPNISCSGPGPIAPVTTSFKGLKYQPRDQIIEEVLGRY